ncbi:copper resistance protein B [Luteibacter rhizovicinus]|uniref:Copper resistance protein B n=1 Tax=Luteibacter rhizovicinus TaxID=242606 RepID=A0A4R3YKG8_9GAMM|nr:copper resistance protein B [Luteibacter rhizovicinus]TCV92740.1 copper resistance protein B [Luteibacter rhizovicinus]
MRRPWVVIAALFLIAQAHAQSAPEQPKMDMDHGSMDHGSMDHSSMAQPATDAPQMDHSAMDHGSMGDMDMGGMSMAPMQGGKAPADARSPDYSDGLVHSPMKHMDMDDSAPVGMLMIDQLESWAGRDDHGQRWEAQGWYGGDTNRLWVRTEGERARGSLEDADIEALWSHAIATFWNTQLGARHDFGEGPGRTWAAFGVQGLAPYWFELEATAYAGQGGRTAARVRAEYEVLFTQRLILQPEFEVNAYGKDDPARGIGSGISDLQLGLRLRYEIRRTFAPYVGVKFVHTMGNTADLIRSEGRRVTDLQWVAGVRVWF